MGMSLGLAQGRPGSCRIRDGNCSFRMQGKRSINKNERQIPASSKKRTILDQATDPKGLRRGTDREVYCGLELVSLARDRQPNGLASDDNLLQFNGIGLVARWRASRKCARTQGPGAGACVHFAGHVDLWFECPERPDPFL